MKGKKAIRVILIVLAVLVVVGGVGWHLTLNLGAAPEETDYAVDIEKVRLLATESGEALPVELHGIVIAVSEAPNSLAIAGGGGDISDWVFPTFQIVYDDRTIVIDPVNDESLLDKLVGEPVFYRDAYDEMQRAMDEAWMIVATHEHFDHVGGLAASPNISDLMGKTVLSREQVESPIIEDAGFPEGVLEAYEPLEYEDLYRLAPGVVLIKSPGHTPGSQMIYVVLDDGTEYLLIGDVVWQWDNIKNATIKPWLASAIMHEDRETLKAETRWLSNVFVSSDTVLIPIINHDAKMIKGYFDDGVIKEGLL